MRKPLSGVSWRRDFPGNPVELPTTRRLIGALLSDHPARDDAIVCLSELASNAIEHTESKNSMYTVDVRVMPQKVRIEVRDAGGPNTPVLRPFDQEEPLEGGRGLRSWQHSALAWVLKETNTEESSGQSFPAA